MKLYRFIFTILAVIGLCCSCERKEISADFAALDVELLNEGNFYLNGAFGFRVKTTHRAYIIDKFTSDIKSDNSSNSVVIGKERSVSDNYEDVIITNNIPLYTEKGRGRISIGIKDPETGYRVEKSLIYTIYPEKNIIISIDSHTSSGTSGYISYPIIFDDRDLEIKFQSSSQELKQIKIERITSPIISGVSSILQEDNNVNMNGGIGIFRIPEQNVIIKNLFDNDNPATIEIEYSIPELPAGKSIEKIDVLPIRGFEIIQMKNDITIQDHNTLTFRFKSNRDRFSIKIEDWARENSINYKDGGNYKISYGNNQVVENYSLDFSISNKTLDKDDSDQFYPYQGEIVITDYRTTNSSQQQSKLFYFTANDSQYTSIINKEFSFKYTEIIDSPVTSIVINTSPDDDGFYYIDSYDKKVIREIEFNEAAHYTIEQESTEGYAEWYMSTEIIPENNYSEIKFSTKRDENYGKYLYIRGDHQQDTKPGGEITLKIGVKYQPDAGEKEIKLYAKYHLALDIIPAVISQYPPLSDPDVAPYFDAWYSVPKTIKANLVNIGNKGENDLYTITTNDAIKQEKHVLVKSFNVNIELERTNQNGFYAYYFKSYFDDALKDGFINYPATLRICDGSKEKAVNLYDNYASKLPKYTSFLGDGQRTDKYRDVKNSIDLDRTTLKCIYANDEVRLAYYKNYCYNSKKESQWKTFYLNVDHIEFDSKKCDVKYVLHRYYKDNYPKEDKPWWTHSSFIGRNYDAKNSEWKDIYSFQNKTYDWYQTVTLWQ